MQAMTLRISGKVSGWQLNTTLRGTWDGVYVLNETGAAPSSRNMAQALGHAATAAWAVMLLATLSWLARAL